VDREDDASQKLRLLSCAFDFGQGCDAAFTNRWIPGVFAYMRRIIPAAFALGSVCAFDLDGESGERFALDSAVWNGWFHFHLGNDEERGQNVAPLLEQFL
jgi:hypothetical protein